MFPQFGSFELQIGDELDVFIAAAGEIHDDCVICWQLTSDTNGRHNGMSCFERGNDAFQLCAESKSFERFCIARLRIIGSPAVAKKRVLRTDCRVVEAGEIECVVAI